MGWSGADGFDDVGAVSGGGSTEGGFKEGGSGRGIKDGCGDGERGTSSEGLGFVGITGLSASGGETN